MAQAFQPRFVDLVRNFTTTVGTGNFALGSAVTGFTSFTGTIQAGETFYYSVISFDKPAEREIGRGTMQPDGTISRAPIGGTLTNFTTGTKTIALVAAAEWFEQVQAGGGGSSAPTRAALSGFAASIGSAILTERGREGIFVYDASDLSANVAADPNQGVYIAPSTDATGASGAWLRAGNVLTPRMFGAIGDGVRDDTAALQAFFDFVRLDAHAVTYVMDWSDGQWGVSNTIYACYNGDNKIKPARQFVMGSLRVLSSVTSPLEWVLEIASTLSNWKGRCHISHAGASHTLTTYSSRRFKNGVRLRFCAYSTFGDFYVDSAKRDCVFADSEAGSGFTVRAGTAYETTFSSSNNIGLKIARVYGRAFGSHHKSSPSYGISTAVSAKTQGTFTGTNYVNETFVAGTTGGPNSASQRTRLTVASTGDMQAKDLVWGRLELTASIYGSIAADNTASTFTWTAGDARTYLEVGDIYPAFDGGVNAGTEFRVVSFDATGRIVTVTPAPVTHAANTTSTYHQTGEPTFHFITQVVDATNVLVYPWWPDRNNSSAYVVHGAAFRSDGGDAANTTVGFVGALLGAIGLQDEGLYGCQINTVLTDYAEVGIKLGEPPSNECNGNSVSHGHLERTTVPVLVCSINAVSSLDIQSVFKLSKCQRLTARASTNQQIKDATLSSNITFVRNGMLYTTADQNSGSGSGWDTKGICNAPRNREVYAHSDTVTLTVSFDRDIARLFPKHHWARIIWTDSDGSSPDGTLTLNMEASLAALGWTFAGEASGTSYSLVAPQSSVVLELQYLPDVKKVAITRVNKPLRVKDDGVEEGSNINRLNFTGAGCGVTVAGSEATIDVPGFSGVTVQDEGVQQGTAITTLNVTGAGSSLTVAGSQATIDVPGFSGVTVKDEGVQQGTAITALNFTGAGSSLTVAGSEATIDVPGFSGVIVQDEGVQQGAGVTTLNVTGAGSSISVSGARELAANS